MQLISKYRKKLSGFTVVEVMIMAPILMLVIGVFIGLIVELAGQSVVSRTQSQAVYDVQDAISRIEQDVKTSIGFLATNSVTIASPQGLNNDATNFLNVAQQSASDRILILNMGATTLNPNDPAVKPVYAVNSPSVCTSVNVVYNTVMKYNVVYFLRSGSLWRRTLMPSTYTSLATWCSTPYQRPSCAAGQVNAMCATEDVEVLPNATVFDLNYYTDASNLTANTVVNNSANTTATRDAAFLGLSTVKVDLTSSRSIAGKTVTKTGTARITIIKYSAF